jgi:flagellar basal body-associated protein FliL
MAEDKKKNTEAPEPARKLPVKTLALVGVLLAMQLSLVGALFVMMGGPEEAAADAAAPDPVMLAQRPREVHVATGKYPNSRTGRTFVYDTEVYIVVAEKHRERVVEQIENMRAQISEDLREIISRADRSQLTEPTLATIKRQLKARFDARFGADEEGKSIVRDVVMNKFTEFQI